MVIEQKANQNYNLFVTIKINECYLWKTKDETVVDLNQKSIKTSEDS